MTEEPQVEISRICEENEQLLSFLYACPVGLLEISLDGMISLMNPLAMQLLLRLDPTAPMNFFNTMEAFSPELRHLVETYSPSQGTICSSHRIFVSAGGRNNSGPEIFSCTIVKLGAERYMVSLADISKEVRQAKKLEEAESWFASLLDSAHDFGVLSLDEAGLILSMNDVFLKQTGFHKEDLVGQTLDFLRVDPLQKGGVSSNEQLALAAREGWYLYEDWQQQSDGSKIWCQILTAVRHDEQHEEHSRVSGYTVVLREGKQRSIDVHLLKRMLTRDHLTGAYNRMHFFEVADRECSRSKRYEQPVSLVMADIDNFKRVNDLHGHASGDYVLKEFAERCLSLLRPSDTIARIGGEEFAIILPTTTLEGAQALAERLRAIVSDAPMTFETRHLRITASFGCAELGKENNLAAMMNGADQALYEAKRAGRNRVATSQANR